MAHVSARRLIIQTGEVRRQHLLQVWWHRRWWNIELRWPRATACKIITVVGVQHFPHLFTYFNGGGRNIVLLRLTPAPKSIILNASKTKTEIKKSLSHTPTKWLSVGVNRNVCQQRSRITQKIKTQNLNQKKKKKRNIWRFFQRRCVQFSTTLDIYGALGTVRYASNTRCIK